MTIEWTRLDQPTFDRIVEALVRHRFGDRVRAVNGRGGDGGIDIEITLDEGELWILQLKFYPEGFSSVWGQRRSAIRESFKSAENHEPARWSLVVPCVCTTPEHDYVTTFNGGKQPPKITVIDRDDLDAWLADAPSIDASFQRTPNSELERMARVYGQERAALLGGISDVASRVCDLGSVVDAVDLDWVVDFEQQGKSTSLTIRPRDPDAPARSPIDLTVRLRDLGEDHADLHRQLDRSIAFAPSDPVLIPHEVIRSLAVNGPPFVAGHYPAADVEIFPTSRSAAIGWPLEIRAFHDDEFIASFEGRVTYAAPGAIGGSIEGDLCDGRLRLRLRLPYSPTGPTDTEPKSLRPGIDLQLNYGAIRPAVVSEVLSTMRVLRAATRLEVTGNGQPLTTLHNNNAPTTSADYDADLLAIEQFADDLDVVQRHTHTFFDIPEYMQPGDRVKLRVARLLIEGFIVASPSAREFTVRLADSGADEWRALVQRPRSVVWPAGSHVVEVAGRSLTIGNVYAIHPQATAVNAQEAIETIDAGNWEGFQVHFRPGDDPFFYIALADVEPAEIRSKRVAWWSLFGVDQPSAPDDLPPAASNGSIE